MCQINKTPGESLGAQLNIMETLEQTLEKKSSEQRDSPPIVHLKNFKLMGQKRPVCPTSSF